MMSAPQSNKAVQGRWLDVEEVRLIADLRIMHAKVDELHSVVEKLKRRHDEADVVKYADYEVLAEDIRKVDEIYLWYVKIKEETDGARLGD